MVIRLHHGAALAIVAAATTWAVATPTAQMQWRPETTIDGAPVLRGLPKDAIPAIDTPRFVPAADATFVRPDEPVLGVVFDGQARAYPTWTLNGHEIVNDTVGNTVFAVTW